MKEAFKPGSFGCHEALHMASYFAGAVEEELVNHPAIQANPEWLSLASDAARRLADLYQAIGSVHLPPDRASLSDRLTALEASICHCRDCAEHREKAGRIVGRRWRSNLT